MKTTMFQVSLFMTSASALLVLASNAAYGTPLHYTRNIGSITNNGYQLVNTVGNGSPRPGNYHYVVAPQHPRPVVVAPVHPRPPVAPQHPRPPVVVAKPPVTSGHPRPPVVVAKPPVVKPPLHPVVAKPPAVKPTVKPQVTPVKPEVAKQQQQQEVAKQQPTTSLAGDLGVKYNLGRDVSATAKYGTDGRYGLGVNAQLSPSFGLDAEAYRKDQDNSIRFGLVYTINPVVAPQHQPTIKLVPVYQEPVVKLVPSSPKYIYVDREVIKFVPYRTGTKAPKGRG